MKSGPVLEALAYMGDNRLQRAWLMFLATYAYTRSWHGAEGPDGQPMDFGRWHSFKCALETGLPYLWKKDT
jgi:hypothetical protein